MISKDIFLITVTLPENYKETSLTNLKIVIIQLNPDLYNKVMKTAAWKYKLLFYM